MQSAALRWSLSYNNCLRFTVGLQGMEIALPLVFAVGHPRLFFPWSEMQIRRDKGFWGAYVVCSLTRVPTIALRIRPRLGGPDTRRGGFRVA